MKVCTILFKYHRKFSKSNFNWLFILILNFNSIKRHKWWKKKAKKYLKISSLICLFVILSDNLIGNSYKWVKDYNYLYADRYGWGIPICRNAQRPSLATKRGRQILFLINGELSKASWLSLSPIVPFKLIISKILITPTKLWTPSLNWFLKQSYHNIRQFYWS